MTTERVHAAPETVATAASPTKAHMRTCLECGEPYAPSQASADFCSVAHRATFNNRRKSRGATLYDLFMVQRFERKVAAKLEIWMLICRLASHWRNEDHAERESRHSWQAPRKILSRLTWLYAITTDIRRRK